MKVHLIRTPEYEIENFEEVQELLSSYDGPLEFVARKFEFNTERFPFLKRFWDDFHLSAHESAIKQINNDENKDQPLSWSELFSLCEFYRQTYRIKKPDFIILLTRRNNALNFFSMFDENKNAFVQTSGWELFTQANSKFPIAYEVVANALRCLMKLPISLPNQWIHQEPLGCINDFCENKKEIILKIRTGDICNDCLLKMRKEKVGDEIINQSLGIFEEIRTQLLFKQGFTKNLKPKPIKIDAEGKIMIGDKEIELDYLPKTLFIFFLNHEEGISLKDLKLYKNELFLIYKKLRPGGNPSSIDGLIIPYHHKFGTFSKNKSSLNKKLKEQLGEPLSNFYYLDGGRGDAFRININPDFVSVDIRY